MQAESCLLRTIRGVTAPSLFIPLPRMSFMVGLAKVRDMLLDVVLEDVEGLMAERADQK